MSPLAKTIQFIKRFRRDEAGNVLMLFGLSIIFLVGIGGSAIDLGMQQLMRTKFQGAADAAATSAGSLTAGSATISVADRTNAANRYFNLNYPPQFYKIVKPTPQITVTSSSVTVLASGDVKTSFVSNFNIPTLPATARSVVQYTLAAGNIYDVSLSIDNSGSMGTADAGGGLTRLQAVQNASNTLTDNFIPVGEKNNRMNINSWDTKVLQHQTFTSDNATIKAKINAMTYKGMGYTDSGKGLTQSITDGNSSNGWHNDTIRSVILLTDGANQYKSPMTNAELTTQNNASLALCKQLKDNNVFVYTIAFGQEVKNNSIVSTFLSTCASGAGGPALGNKGSYFFIAPDASTLNLTFQQIAKSVRSTRISQ